MSTAFEEMAKEKLDDSLLPISVRTFLKRHLDLHQYRERQQAYFLLYAKKPNNCLKHLVQSYAQNIFWKHLLLSIVEKTDHSAKLIQHGLEDFIERMLQKTGKWCSFCYIFIYTCSSIGICFFRQTCLMMNVLLEPIKPSRLLNTGHSVI